MPNPFANWSPQMVAAHNQRIKNAAMFSPDNPGKIAFVEHAPIHEPLAKAQVQKEVAGRILVRIISIRQRLLDEDNIGEKWTVDCLRYGKFIPGDEPDKIKIETTQRKCRQDEQEHTRIEIYYP